MKNILLLVLVSVAFAKTDPDPHFKDIHSIFVSGNNQAAEQVQAELEKDTAKGKGCFVLATNPKEADASLALATDSNSQGQGLGSPGSFGGRNWIVSGTLTTKNGDQLWSHSERFSDAPFRSGGKVAGKLVYLRLRREACGR